MRPFIKITILLLGAVVFLNSCHKDEPLFATHVKGRVTDYFDGTELVGITVALVYTYDFLEHTPCNGYNTSCGNPPVAPDTLLKVYTDKYGEFSFKFRPKKKDQKGQGYNSIFGDEGVYGYLLIFYKDGTEYYKQYYKINDPDKKQVVEYKLRSPMHFKFHIVNEVPRYIDDELSLGVNSDISYGSGVRLKGENIDTTINYTLVFQNTAYVGVSHFNLPQGNHGTFLINKKIDELNKYNEYEILY